MSDEQLAYSWLNGLKGSWEAVKRGGHDYIKSHPYVQKVMEHHGRLIPDTSRAAASSDPKLSKALFAGYGGASAPTDRAGGAVLQTESLDAAGREAHKVEKDKGKRRAEFVYITCDNCGKEQIHSKYQVKCRHCGHSFSFEKLLRALS